MKKRCKISYRKKREIHGMTDSKEYQAWASMRNRIKHPYKANKNYYGKIKICDEWFNSFNTFLKDMGKSPSKEYSIDRIDNNGNYCKENCRWATRVEQANNRSSNMKIEYNGNIYTLTEVCKILNLKYDVIKARINHYNWDIKKALETPLKNNQKHHDK
jgi:hypothetical protein